MQATLRLVFLTMINLIKIPLGWSVPRLVYWVIADSVQFTISTESYSSSLQRFFFIAPALLGLFGTPFPLGLSLGLEDSD